MNDNAAAVLLILGTMFLLMRGCDEDHRPAMMRLCLEHQGFEWRDNGCVKVVEHGIEGK